MKKLSTLAAVVISLILCSINVRCEEDKDRYQRYVAQICEDYDMCPELIEAIIETESNWDAKATNGNCVGLMQINKKIHKARMKKLGVKNLKNPYGNILVGVDLLTELVEQYDDIGTALNIYSMGTKGAKLAAKGKYSYYTRHILKRSEELERLHGK